MIKSIKDLSQPISPGILVNELVRIQNSLLKTESLRKELPEGVKLLRINTQCDVLLRSLCFPWDFAGNPDRVLDPKSLIGEAKQIYDLCIQNGIKVQLHYVDEWGGRQGFDMIAILVGESQT